MNNNIIKGTYWTGISTISVAIVQICRLAILTRFLDKGDFGIVAIITFLLGLTYTFCDLGFSAAIMHKKDISQVEFSSLYWAQFIIFILMYAGVCACSKSISLLYNEPSIKVLLPIALLDLPLNGIGKLYETILLKQFKFKQIAIRNVISAICSIIVAYLFAAKGYGIYSYIISTLFNTVFLNIWNLLLGVQEMRLLFTLKLKKILPLAKIGIFQTGTQIIDYFSTKIDIIIIGKFLGTESLGVYNLAKELLMKVVQVINSIANRVALPYFSKIQNDRKSMHINYCKMLNVLSSVNFPIVTIIGIVSLPLLSILYGEQYTDISSILLILSFWAMFACVGNPIGSVTVATGRTDLSFLYTILRLLVYVPVTYITAKGSLITLSIGQVILAFLSIHGTYYIILRKTIGLKYKYFVASFSSIFFFSSILVVPMYKLVSKNLFNLPNSVIELIVYGFLCFVFYIAYFFFFQRDTLKLFFEILPIKKSYQ